MGKKSRRVIFDRGFRHQPPPFRKFPGRTRTPDDKPAEPVGQCPRCTADVIDGVCVNCGYRP